MGVGECGGGIGDGSFWGLRLVELSLGFEVVAAFLVRVLLCRSWCRFWGEGTGELLSGGAMVSLSTGLGASGVLLVGMGGRVGLGWESSATASDTLSGNDEAGEEVRPEKLWDCDAGTWISGVDNLRLREEGWRDEEVESRS